MKKMLLPKKAAFIFLFFINLNVNFVIYIKNFFHFLNNHI